MAESKLLSNIEEDRLSSLPDAILIDILSRIPTNFSTSTSVLSHRWRNLWTAVTRLNLSPSASDFTAIVDHILGQLTSPKLTEFELNLASPTEFPEHHVVESCFRGVYDRFVEKVLIDVLCSFYEEIFQVPFCLLNSQSLVVLELSGKLNFDLELPGNGDVIHLPKLKKLKLDFLLDVPIWLGTLIRVCPLLEDLYLVFKLDVVESEIADCVEILGLNLKSLKIDLASSITAKHTKMSIDAPKLETLEILDCCSYYYFVHNPSSLVNACIDLRRDDEFVDELEEDTYYGFRNPMSEFVAGMSCVSNLDLKLDYHTNILPFSDGVFPVFGNLTHFKITLHGIIGLNGWNDLLVSLQVCPKLKHLEVVSMEAPTPEFIKFCPPNYVPECFLSTLETIQIWGIDGDDDELNELLGYILCNAGHLEQLYVNPTNWCIIKEEQEEGNAQCKERQFCEFLFKLPRKSSTCEVVFSGRSIRASSNTFKNE